MGMTVEQAMAKVVRDIDANIEQELDASQLRLLERGATPRTAFAVLAEQLAIVADWRATELPTTLAKIRQQLLAATSD